MTLCKPAPGTRLERNGRVRVVCDVPAGAHELIRQIHANFVVWRWEHESSGFRSCSPKQWAKWARDKGGAA